MKTLLSIAALLFFWGFVSCTSDAGLSEQISETEEVMFEYGAEYVSVAASMEGEIPTVSISEMRSVLQTLRANAGNVKECSLNSADGDNLLKVRLSENYRVASRADADGSFTLGINLKFGYEGGAVFYRGAEYEYSSSLFVWANGSTSLAPVRNTDGCTYSFDSDSYLYFKLKEEGGTIVRVPGRFHGNCSFLSGKGTYSFSL